LQEQCRPRTIPPQGSAERKGAHGTGFTPSANYRVYCRTVIGLSLMMLTH